MKKILPVLLLVLGIIIVGIVLAVERSVNTSATPEKTSEPIIEIPLDQRPYVSLTPTSDGHWLKLKVEDIKMNAKTLDYELIYTIADGRQQGVPGTISLNGATSIDRDLLLGSESSGKFKYDQGVEKGTLTLKFRDNSGRLMGKLSTDFHLQKGADVLTSVDGSFKYTLDKKTPDVFFVVMKTFAKEGYSIFASDNLRHSGSEG
jgi:hypothetical protein